MANKAALNTKSSEIENKIRDITNRTTKAAFNSKAKEIENKLPDAANLLTKTWVDFIIKDLHSNHKEIDLFRFSCW